MQANGRANGHQEGAEADERLNDIRDSDNMPITPPKPTKINTTRPRQAQRQIRAEELNRHYRHSVRMAGIRHYISMAMRLT